MAHRVLIVAYGNPLRSDDGVAWHAADLLRERLSPNEAEIVCVHQLTPELAESMSQAGGAIFLDARQSGEPGQICHTRVIPETRTVHGTHTLTPAQLAALTNALYGTTVDAYEVALTGESFAHGEGLSDTVEEALPLLVEVVEQVTEQIQQGHRETGVGDIAEQAGDMYGNPHPSS